jgi:hypothetical protein
MRDHIKLESIIRVLVYSFWFITGILASGNIAAQSPDALTGATQVLRIQGPITEQTRLAVATQTRYLKNTDTIPASLIVLVNSAGGDGEAAMATGRILRQHQAHVFVIGRCDSACVFILAGGVVRTGGPGALGVHAGRLAHTNEQGRITREIDARQNLDDSFRLTDFNSQVRHYLNDMGIGQGLLDVMLAHPTKTVYRLSPQETDRFKLYGFNQDYLNQYTTHYNKKNMRHAITQKQLANRIRLVPNKCRARVENPSKFSDCYLQVLQNH